MSSKKNFLVCVCMYKMVDIRAKTWINTEVSVIKIHKNDNVNKTVLLILCISDAGKRWNGESLYDLTDRAIKRKYGVKNMSDLTKQQIRKYKIDRAKLIKVSKHCMYFHEDILIPIIMQSRLSDLKTIKRTDLGFNQINLILKKEPLLKAFSIYFFCRKNKAATQSLEKTNK